MSAEEYKRFPVVRDSSRDTLESTGIGSKTMPLCATHQKELDVVDLDQRIKICSHCALFGAYKDHHLRPIREINQ